MCVWVCFVLMTRNQNYLSSPQTALHTGSFPKSALLKHKLIITNDDPLIGEDIWGWELVHISVIVKDVFSSLRLCCFSLVTLENQGTAWAGGLLSKIKEKFKTRRNVSKCREILDTEIKVSTSQFCQPQTCSISTWKVWKESRTFAQMWRINIKKYAVRKHRIGKHLVCSLWEEGVFKITISVVLLINLC